MSASLISLLSGLRPHRIAPLPVTGITAELLPSAYHFASSLEDRMAGKISQQIERLRMNVSRYERDEHPVPSHTLLALGLLAKQAGRDGWVFWDRAGITREDARVALAQVKVRAAVAGRG